MKFILHYRGSLKADGSPKHKHNLRQHFHQQLKELYNQPPLNYYWQSQLNPTDRPDLSPLRIAIRRSIDSFEFLPLVHSAWYLAAGLRITLLRPEPPGKIVTQSGDIDNRLKTLLDALKVPDPGSLPKNASPGINEAPFFCLLQDDNLITDLEVVTDRLLAPSTSNPSVVVLLVNVQIKVLIANDSNIIFLGD